MIRVVIKRNPDRWIETITITGHANFAEHGSDLVCAGVSAVAFGSLNAVEALSGINLSVEQGGDGGYLHVQVPKNVSQDNLEKAQLLLEGMIVALETIEASYGDYIKITYKQ